MFESAVSFCLVKRPQAGNVLSVSDLMKVLVVDRLRLGFQRLATGTQRLYPFRPLPVFQGDCCTDSKGLALRRVRSEGLVRALVDHVRVVVGTDCSSMLTAPPVIAVLVRSARGLLREPHCLARLTHTMCLTEPSRERPLLGRLHSLIYRSF